MIPLVRLSRRNAEAIVNGFGREVVAIDVSDTARAVVDHFQSPLEVARIVRLEYRLNGSVRRVPDLTAQVIFPRYTHNVSTKPDPLYFPLNPDCDRWH